MKKSQIKITKKENKSKAKPLKRTLTNRTFVPSKSLASKIKKSKNLYQSLSFILPDYRYFKLKATVYRIQQPMDFMQLEAQVDAFSDNFFSRKFNNEQGQASDPFNTTIYSNQNTTGHDIVIKVAGFYKFQSGKDNPWTPMQVRLEGTNNTFTYKFGWDQIFLNIDIKIY